LTGSYFLQDAMITNEQLVVIFDFIDNQFETFILPIVYTFAFFAENGMYNP
jgi:hypothetical protein